MPLETGAVVTLPDRVANHVRVLRLREGGDLMLFNGSGDEYPGVLRSVGKKAVVVEVGAGQAGMAEAPIALHLGLALIKRDPMDSALQKATELGVTSVTPLLTDYVSVRHGSADSRSAHWQNVMTSAAEQCGRSHIPDLHPTEPFAAFAARSAGPELRLLPHPGGKASMRDFANRQPESVTFAVGPEGGFSDAEVAYAAAAAWHVIGLGPRILRADTAPLTLLALTQLLWGDF